MQSFRRPFIVLDNHIAIKDNFGLILSLKITTLFFSCPIHNNAAALLGGDVSHHGAYPARTLIQVHI
ncbi:hypothetical protein PL75_08260 [Neisseria arctica]|uniref:Uncharacterized protein n=1 Tax=Neisseria arctica TaxID=1470200 RepID=A0A0J0YQJ0_9NEIS|nr:hypothetical protein PL75_08260 [Neisseria arctica]